jgi:NADH-quinone oxidoreductase subunit K
MHLLYPLLLSALLFAVGVYGLLARRNAVLVLMSVELMLNAVNLNLVAFDAWLRDTLHSGQVFALFVITIAAAEVGVGLAIVLQVFRLRATVAVDELDDLADPDVPPRERAERGGVEPSGGPAADQAAVAGGDPATTPATTPAAASVAAERNLP